MEKILDINRLSVRAAGKEIIHNVNLDVLSGEVVALLGPNGAGKTSLVRAIACDDYSCEGEIKYLGDDILNDSADKRARNGIFLSYQEPVTIPGLSYFEMLRSALEARGEKISLRDFNLRLAKCLEQLELDAFIAKKEINNDLSGGEKKKLEIAQMLLLEPKLIILDEIDSGLDVDSAELASEVVNKYIKRAKAGAIIITHNMRILRKLSVNKVVILRDGKIDKIGDETLINEIKENGFKNA